MRDAAILARDLRLAPPRQTLIKPDRTPVTIADFAVQALIADRLARAFRQDSLVAISNGLLHPALVDAIRRVT